ncbi:TetR/AcrR family transcriptional regulator [Microlunatus soli]|uniref:DNA-binding transcriptional regulator, AcrR family n=1 Tax=Microlunatus soli TaxID=630515 RepID=A0A1H1UWK7_9ACTN|nr:TetR/AcrR family transcriptional regulator [Microlunatus soli]SDS76843.1 DNA-binding transcriptional regulator, AcrR family [Microlunatus soli]
MIDDDPVRSGLVAAADRLFYARGVQAVGMDAVRSEAGVSLKRMYNLFPSKDDLVVAVLAHRSRIWDDGIAAAAEGLTEPQDRILAIFDFLADWFTQSDFRGCAFINVYGELGPNSSKAAAAVERQKRAFADYVAALVREADLPADLAPQIVLLAEGAQTTAAILDDPAAAGQGRRAAETLLGAAAAA